MQGLSLFGILDGDALWIWQQLILGLRQGEGGSGEGWERLSLEQPCWYSGRIFKKGRECPMGGEMVFCKGGGCTAKLGPGVLDYVLKKIPGRKDENLLVGYDRGDDGAVYKLTDELAIVQTLDFFPPMVEDPYLFGQIAAANALSDIYAMGGQVKTALNIVCFPESMDLNILGAILEGGANKVQEAGGVLAGGHSIADEGVKYGLSVTGIVHPDRIYQNHTPCPGDCLLLTKPLGVGIITTAARVGESSTEAMEKAAASMKTLNKESAALLSHYTVHACTDVTGFGFLGHLNEMLGEKGFAVIHQEQIPYIPEAYGYADAFLLTAAAQRNRNFIGNKVTFEDRVPFAMEEILFDPQTSGGLLISLPRNQGERLLGELKDLGLPCGIVGEVLEQGKNRIVVK